MCVNNMILCKTMTRSFRSKTPRKRRTQQDQRYIPGLCLQSEVRELGRHDGELVAVEGDCGCGLVDVEIDQDMAMECKVDQVR